MSGSSAHDTGKPSQRCCLGLLYYSQALEEEGKRPMCLGFPHTPTERVHIEESREADQARDFKFLCLGHSLYERHPATASEGAAVDGTVKRTLPYCEGLEVILGATVDATAAAAAAARTTEAGASAAAMAAAAAAPAAAAGRPSQQPDDLAAVLTSIFGGDESPVVQGTSKFLKIANRNWDRMKSTAGQAYSMTLKPLIDKLSGDQ